MAEYIELNELQKFCRKYTEVDAVGLILANRTDLLHTSDLIERSKIDKAIEEIENEIKFWDCPVNYQEPLLVQKVKQAKANSYRHALEIIKRNIGEQV